MEKPTTLSQEFTLLSDHEYRIEVSETQKLKLQIIEGVAEVKGQELLNEKYYVFSDIKTYIYTFHGCKIRVEGEYEVAYVSEYTHVSKLYNFFRSLISPEKVLIVGKGRFTACTTLINYFIRIHKKILFTELDVTTGNLVFPGVLGSVEIDKLIAYNEGINQSSILAYFYGTTEYKNIEYYNTILRELSNTIKEKEFKDTQIILGPNNPDRIESIIKEFPIDKVLVVGDERMYNMLKVPNKISIHGGNGYVEDNYLIDKRIHYYFYGRKGDLTPYSLSLRKEYEIVRIGEEHIAPMSALPLGAARKVSSDTIKPVEPVERAVMGISQANNINEVDKLPVIGFVVVNFVVKKENEIESVKILCPQSKIPKQKFYIQGDIKYSQF
ncbi:Polyribonucleotide 5'-hydroxyl-kinase Clp1 [Astathelohania contejeani]|uniref:Polynucleotide 5'-hydroxyl-kinase GRC3 n=1 Tax=Astathelohania contejeani TaxID=164912 RepID=A0ABQ7HXE7_9MICR|nr:Polyribonucleotide 5'-hydroxyl-kinase Clp1 [Thelohania contejeani]